MATQTMNQEHVYPQSTQATAASSRLVRWLPTGMLLIAAILLVASIAFPYWGLVLEAPQYPGGLEMRVFINYMTGDEDPRLDEVREIDGLNHYIGMKSLYDAATVERAIAVPGVIIMVVSLAAVAFVRRRWLWLLAVPAIVFPAVFLGDLAYWLNHYGQNLDPYAPLSSAIGPFTPTILGEGIIGQFRTVAYVSPGWIMAATASVLVLGALLIRWFEHTRTRRGQ
ncbi:MAG: cytochrome C [Chloroflexi bacterium]|nr:cytochrome C [Chloroflexota bacterium]